MEWGTFVRLQASVADALRLQRAPGGHRGLLRRQDHPFDAEVCRQLKASVKITNKHQLLPLIIDQLYTCVCWTGRVPVVVFTHEANGKGDLMLGVKAARALRLGFPPTADNASDVVLLTAGAAHVKEPGVFAGCGMPFCVLPGSSQTPPAPALDASPELVLVAPQLAGTKSFQTSATDAWGCELLAITEYSKRESAPFGCDAPTIASGLRDGELGITFDASLRVYKLAQDRAGDAAARRRARLEQLPELAAGCPDLLKAIVGVGGDAGAGAVAEAATAMARNAASRLYFAYSNKSALRFAMVLAFLEKEAANEVCVVQACPEFWGIANPGKEHLLELFAEAGPWTRALAETGVAQVQLVEFADGGSGARTATTTYRCAAEGRTLRWIITRSGIPHASVLTLVRACEPIMMTTGNQSTSEALSAGKTIYYESIGFEQSWAFMDSLYGGAGASRDQQAALRAMSADYGTGGGRRPDLAQFEAAAGALTALEGSGAFRTFSDRAAAARDLGRCLAGRFLRRFLMSCADLRGPLGLAEEALSSNISAEGFALFVRTLQELADL